MIVQHFPIVILVVNFFHCLVLYELNIKIIKVRDDEDKFGGEVIEEFKEGTNVILKDNFFNVFNEETKQKHRKTLKRHSTAVYDLTEKQTAIINDATLSKKAEIYLESLPQAILQLYIIAISNDISGSQVVTIVSSILVATLGTMRTYLNEPTKVNFNLSKPIKKPFLQSFLLLHFRGSQRRTRIGEIWC